MSNQVQQHFTRAAIVETLACYPHNYFASDKAFDTTREIRAAVLNLSGACVAATKAASSTSAMPVGVTITLDSTIGIFIDLVRKKHPSPRHAQIHPEQKLLTVWLKDAWSNRTGSQYQKRATKNLLLDLIQKHGYSRWDVISALAEYAVRIWTSTVEDEDTYRGVVREIRFEPEHQQAGIGILNYFSVILKQRLPDAPATVTIRQHVDRVTLTITGPDGSKEAIERLYEHYGLVVTGEETPESLLSGVVEVLALKQKLEIAHLELRQAREIKLLERRYGESSAAASELEIAFLRQQLGNQLAGTTSLHAKVLELAHTCVESKLNPNAIELLSSIVARDEPALQRSVARLKESEPSLLARLHDFVYSSVFGGVIGNTVYDWLKVVWPVLPK